MIGIGLVLNTIVMTVLLATGLHYLVCQVAATVLILFWHYFIASRWVFAGAPAKQPGASP
jgi:putative flippase GtrA